MRIMSQLGNSARDLLQERKDEDLPHLPQDLYRRWAEFLPRRRVCAHYRVGPAGRDGDDEPAAVHRSKRGGRTGNTNFVRWPAQIFNAAEEVVESLDLGAGDSCGTTSHLRRRLWRVTD